MSKIIPLLVERASRLETRFDNWLRGTTSSSATSRNMPPNGSNSNGSHPNNYPRHRRDVYEAFSILRHLLPAELVPGILYHASYCTCKPTRITQDCIVRCEGDVTKRRVYLASNRPLKKLESGHVRKVRFVVESRDQGWATFPDRGSYSWWEVGVVSSDLRTPIDKGSKSREEVDGVSGAEVDPVEEHANEDENWRRWGAPDEEAVEEHDGVVQVRGVRSASGKKYSVQRRRHLANNDLMGKNYRRHEIEWTADAEDLDEAAWVSSLQEGDTVVLIACALHVAWENAVREASIELWTPDVR